ncbi:MAG TPA: hypothetical protein VM925_31620 [Labilithrix sp.]|nr:hypothetical protein [Labilithrix sp.]
MKKAALALTTLAALTVTTVALAEEPNKAEGPTSTLPDSSTTSGGTQGSSPTTPTPAPQTTSTTTITSAEAMPAPVALAPPPARETITLKQSVRPNRGLLYTGGAMLIGSYATTAAMTATRDIRDGNGDQSLFIPVAGPWLHLANSSETPLNTALIAGSGVAQGVGTVLGMLSLIVPERIPAATIQAGGVKMQLTATSYGRGSAGIGAVGQF